MVLEAGKTKEIHIQTANVYRGTILIGKPFCPVYMGATDTRRDAWGSVEVALDWPQVYGQSEGNYQDYFYRLFLSAVRTREQA